MQLLTFLFRKKELLAEGWKMQRTDGYETGTLLPP
jgi:hypothetical protein